MQPSTVDFSHTGPDDAARVALDSSIAVAQMVQRCAADVTSRFERGEAVAIGDITPKLVGELARAMYTSNELLKRAIELQQQQQPNERQAFWIKLGELIDRCTPEEQDLLAKTGELPAHLTGGYTFLSHDDDA